MSPGPEMPRNRTKRNIEIFRRFPGGARHMEVLTLLLPETRFIEILSPLQEGLGLSDNHALADRVTVGTHRGTLNSGFHDSLVGHANLVRCSDLAFRRQMTTRAGETAGFLLLRTRYRLFHLGRIDW